MWNFLDDFFLLIIQDFLLGIILPSMYDKFKSKSNTTNSMLMNKFRTKSNFKKVRNSKAPVQKATFD